MRTPAGTECPFYFEDYYRGREKHACRLIERTPGGGRWTPDLCAKCRVPRILMANACPNMILEARVCSRFLGFGRKVEISASCTYTLAPVEIPEIGCGHCHEAIPINHAPAEDA